jgi:hypothetical protein
MKWILTKSRLQLSIGDKVEAEEHSGESGKAFWKVFKQGNIRVRMVEYTPVILQIMVLKGSCNFSPRRRNDDRT